MPITSYRIFQNASQPRRDSRPGIGHYCFDSAIYVVAKKSTNNPFAIFNEAMAVELGAYLELPIAHGIPLTGFAIPKTPAITKDSVFWASLSVGEELPDPDCDLMVTECEMISTGILVFDAWIVNPDRHDLNLSYRTATREVQIFDHDVAICGQTGVQNLEFHRNSLSFLENHAIAIYLDSLRFVTHWIERVCKIQNERILGAASRFSDYLPDPTKVRSIAEELILRKKMLAYMFFNAAKDPNDSLFPVATKELNLLSNVCLAEPSRIDVEVQNDSSYSI
jgi:hypothetical protein